LCVPESAPECLEWEEVSSLYLFFYTPVSIRPWRKYRSLFVQSK
jgi:hypothetical protein